MPTIKDLEEEAEKSRKLWEALKELGLLPAGYRPSVRLHGKSRDKRRSASFEKNWSPESDSILIGFRPAAEEPGSDSRSADRETQAARRYPRETPEAKVRTEAVRALASTVTDRITDLIQALDRAEKRPGFDFVALKWFRDTALPAEGFAWTNDDLARQTLLRDAIDQRFILTSRLPNPRSPQFPVTAIRLNRLMPRVAAILGSRDAGVTDFQPVSIRGEALSQTVLRDRR